MLKRKYRLGKDINFYKSLSFSSSLFTLKVKDGNLQLNRFGIIVSKRVDKRAVKRNRIKRILWTCLFETYDKLLPGHDILFIIKKKAGEKSKAEMQKETREIFKKAKILSSTESVRDLL